MSNIPLSKRELFIKSMFLPETKSPKKTYLDEKIVNKLIEDISSIGERYGFIGDSESEDFEKSEKRKHKYDVWIAKEVKKNLDIINHFDDIRMIIDWAIETKADVFKYDFESSFKAQERWHNEMYNKYDIKKIEFPEIDKKRILFRCSNKTHFFYLLQTKDLLYEGVKMKNCVGGQNYKSRVKNERSIIVSLRDELNHPHVTTEIDSKTRTVIQQKGGGNTSVKPEYKKMILEFVLFLKNYKNIENYDILKLLNLNYL